MEDILGTEFMQKFYSKFWRLNNLYYILNKDGEKIKLTLNNSQAKVLRDYQHTKKIILKSRQQGISTLFLVHNFDSCLTKPGFQAGIQSYGLRESNKLVERAKFMWDNLDENIKKLLQIDLVGANAQTGLTFSNGAILKIGNIRGDTVQSLHVSELGKIAKESPQKAKELKTGAFQAVGKNNKISIESTAEGASGMFYDMCMKAMQFEERNKQLIAEGKEPQPLGPFDFQFIFLPWYDDPDCNIDTPYPINKTLELYFEDIEKSQNIKLVSTQKWWYVSKLNELGDSMKQEYPTTAKEAFEQSVEGTYYEKQFKYLEIKDNLYNPNSYVITSWDIGMNDENTILFSQINGNYLDIIAEYSNSGEGLPYYADILQELTKHRGYCYDFDLFPHDVSVREYGSGDERIKIARRLGLNPRRVKKYSIAEGIEHTRLMMAGKLSIGGKYYQLRIDSSCKDLLKAIQLYRKKFDKRLGVFLDKPEHDEYSHWADNLRMLANGLKHNTPRTGVPSNIVTQHNNNANLNYNSLFSDSFAI